MLLMEILSGRSNIGWYVISSDGYAVDGPHTNAELAFNHIRSLAKRGHNAQITHWKVRYGFANNDTGEFTMLAQQDKNSKREGIGESDEGWFVVFRHYAERGPYLSKADAEKKRSDLVNHAQEYTWDNTRVMFGKRSHDGSNEFIFTRAVTPKE